MTVLERLAVSTERKNKLVLHVLEKLDYNHIIMGLSDIHRSKLSNCVLHQNSSQSLMRVSQPFSRVQPISPASPRARHMRLELSSLRT